MKIKGTVAVSAMSGRNAGAVHSKNGVARGMAVPKNKRTSAQQTVRNVFAQTSRAWGALTDAQRNSWIQGAVNFPYSDVFGQRKVLSGKALYNQLNNNALLAGGSAINTCPAPASVSNITAVAFGSNTNAAQTVTFTPTPVGASTAYVIEMTAPSSTGTMTPADGKFKRITVLAAAATSPANTFSAYQSVLGTPVTGRKIFGRIYAVNLTTGQVSPAVSFSGTTA